MKSEVVRLQRAIAALEGTPVTSSVTVTAPKKIGKPWSAAKKAAMSRKLKALWAAKKKAANAKKN